MGFSSSKVGRGQGGLLRLRNSGSCRASRLLRSVAAGVMVASVCGFPALVVSPVVAAAELAATSPGPTGFQFSAEPYTVQNAPQRALFSYDLEAGHQILDQLVVKNVGASSESFVVYGEDATNLPRTGGYGFQQRSQMHNTAVGTWLTVGTPQFTVPPGMELVATFKLAIPANASPGDHVGGVVVEQVKAHPPQTQPVGVNVVLRTVIPMYVHVEGGSFPALTIENLTVFHQSPTFPYLQGSKVAVRFDLVNTGNEIINPKSVTVSIRGQLSGTIHKYTAVQAGERQSGANPLPAQMLPGARLTLTEEWSGIPPFDPLSGHVSASAIDPGTTRAITTAASTPFWYFPWILVLLFLALVASVIALIVVRRRRRADSGRVPVGPEDGSDSGAPGRTPSMSGT